jgi:hypothetical protein
MQKHHCQNKKPIKQTKTPSSHIRRILRIHGIRNESNTTIHEIAQTACYNTNKN